MMVSGNSLRVFDVYATAVELISKWKKDSPTISHVWFSDTFVFYSQDESGQNFALIEQGGSLVFV